ncbi:MAG: hypothetical protein ACM3O3_12685 [Syntrophothermus sp.]
MSISFTGNETHFTIYTAGDYAWLYYGNKLTYCNGYWYVLIDISDSVEELKLYKSSDLINWTNTNYSSATGHDSSTLCSGSNKVFIVSKHSTTYSYDLIIYNGSSFTTVLLPTLPTTSTTIWRIYVVVDSNGNPHVVLHTTSTTVAKRKFYHTRYDCNSSTWDSWEIINDASYNTVYLYSITIDDNDIIHILGHYRLTSTGTIYKVYSCGNTGSWTAWENMNTYFTDGVNDVDMVYYNNVLYILWTGADYFKVLYGSSGSWSDDTIESSGAVQTFYQYGHLCVDNTGVIHVVCHDTNYYPTTTRLIYANNSTGSFVKVEMSDNNPRYLYSNIYYANNALLIIVSDEITGNVYGYKVLQSTANHAPMFQYNGSEFKRVRKLQNYQSGFNLSKSTKYYIESNWERVTI